MKVFFTVLLLATFSVRSNIDDIIHAIRTKDADQAIALCKKYDAWKLPDFLIGEAIKNNLYSFIEFLVCHGINPTIDDYKSAIHSNDEHLMNILLLASAYPRNVLKEAVEKGNSAIVRGLLQTGIDPDEKIGHSLRPLEVAVNNDDRVIALLLLKAGAHPFLINPARCRSSEMREIIMKAWEEALRNETELNAAIQARKSAILKRLFYQKSTLGKRQLHQSIAKRAAHQVKLLCQAGGPINEFYRGKTALNEAIKLQDFRIVSILLNNGANVNMPDYADNYPLALAQANDSWEVMRLLLARGAGNHDLRHMS